MFFITLPFLGYPRTLPQAKFLYNYCCQFSMAVQPNNFEKAPISASLSAIDIRLEQWIAVEKLLGRRQCATCGGSFNTANIVVGDYFMPSTLPDPVQCEANRGLPCRPDLITRDDDTESIIQTRFLEHQRNTEPILDYFKSLGILKTFEVKRGVQDLEKLIHVMSTDKECN